MSTPSADRGDTRRRADAVRNRERVLDATRALLADGAATTTITVETIARRAGVGGATVVRTFGSKDALIDVAVAGLLEPVVERARALLTETNAGDALRRFLPELIAFQSSHWAISEQVGNLDLPATTAQRDALTRAVAEMVQRALDDGAIRADIDPTTTMILIRETTHAVARSSQASPRLAEAYISVLMDGLHPDRQT